MIRRLLRMFHQTDSHSSPTVGKTAKSKIPLPHVFDGNEYKQMIEGPYNYFDRRKKQSMMKALESWLLWRESMYCDDNPNLGLLSDLNNIPTKALERYRIVKWYDVLKSVRKRDLTHIGNYFSVLYNGILPVCLDRISDNIIRSVAEIVTVTGRDSHAEITVVVRAVVYDPDKYKSFIWFDLYE